MDLFKKKCPAHNLILGQRESCPVCLAERRYELQAETAADIGGRMCTTTEKRRDRTRGRFYFMNGLMIPEHCPHGLHYDPIMAVCHGCGLTAQQLVRQGYAERLEPLQPTLLARVRLPA